MSYSKRKWFGGKSQNILGGGLMLLCSLASACTSQKDAEYYAMLSSGCGSVSSCLGLAEDAKRRHHDCLEPGEVSCASTRMDWIRAMDLLHHQRGIIARKASRADEIEQQKARQLQREQSQERLEKAQKELAAWKVSDKQRRLREEEERLRAEEQRLGAEERRRSEEAKTRSEKARREAPPPEPELEKAVPAKVTTPASEPSSAQSSASVSE